MQFFKKITSFVLEISVLVSVGFSAIFYPATALAYYEECVKIRAHFFEQNPIAKRFGMAMMLGALAAIGFLIGLCLGFLKLLTPLAGFSFFFSCIFLYAIGGGFFISGITKRSK